MLLFHIMMLLFREGESETKKKKKELKTVESNSAVKPHYPLWRDHNHLLTLNHKQWL